MNQNANKTLNFTILLEKEYQFSMSLFYGSHMNDIN